MFSFLILAVLVACAPAQPPRPIVPPPEQDSCQAGQFSYLIGQEATALERVLIMRPVRVIRPGDAVTMDFRSNRINFSIDGSNRVVRITCG